MFNTPILFIIFNRPDITSRVFKEIKKQKPKFLFVAADGPRPGVEYDIDKCRKARELVLNGIDWDCEVKTLFRKENLGCGKGVSSAIDWFFENVEQGIILEDDCLPHPSFFMYCETLLNKYKHNENIYAISGDNFQNGIRRGDASYYFSHYVYVWGWASWRRAWKHYDFDLGELEELKSNKLFEKIDKRKNFKEYWLKLFEKVKQKEIDTWDYQWLFTIWKNNGLTVVPNTNLISNIGFSKEATHTKDLSLLANLETEDIGLIKSPKIITVDISAHNYDSKMVYNINSGKDKLKGFLNVLLEKYKRKKFKQKINLKKKLRKLIAREIIDLLKRKTGNSTNKTPKLLQLPRYTKTTIELNGKELIIPDNASFRFMYREIFEEEIYKFITTNSEPYIIDGGANIGLAAIYFKELYPNAKIIAFEPDPEIFKILKNNIEVFNFQNIELVQKGLWDSKSKLNFFSEGADAGLITTLDNSRVSPLEIETISLKEYLNQPVDFLKLDIEGAETIVLKDIEDDLCKVERIFVEYHSFVDQPQTLNEIVNILTRAKFRIYMSIPGNNSLKSPFLGLIPYNNMDFQLNFFGYKEEIKTNNKI
ncbi:FkbM family methyltransferase [Gillisia sp. Hel_I_86]|uniref:FkbM family methyltransferase n=1 Tax=Gillisia sp. Hel_I_86 TaxID=1249981 RepID=UPI001199D229|nr:FkbM family methyltransferase [Gillisia sp. Hel_I_86]TVZ25583.1 FkbM family methyltransferase [Gillisia sp. Hel_I_86]